MKPWELVLSEQAFRAVLALKPSERQKLIRTMEAIANDPMREPAARFTTAEGRRASVVFTDRHAIAYWLDPWAVEVRVVDLKPINRG